MKPEHQNDGLHVSLELEVQASQVSRSKIKSTGRIYCLFDNKWAVSGGKPNQK